MRPTGPVDTQGLVVYGEQPRMCVSKHIYVFRLKRIAFTHKHGHIHLLYSISSSLSKHFSQFFSPHCICQTVVNFISELQEQMCRFQKEINSKIQEKKALESEIPADGSSPVACPTESTKGEGSNPGPSCDRTSEEVPDGPDGDTHSLAESSSDAEQQYHCEEESVGTACLHDS